MRQPNLLAALVAASIAAACGARTQLPGDRLDDGGEGGSGLAPSQSSITVGPIATSTTTGSGGGGNDGGGGQNEAGGPPIEECDPDVLFIYLVSSQNQLYRYDPVNLDIELVGSLSCPTRFGGSPFSMAVSRSGRAYSVFSTGELFRISVKNAACSATDWEPRQLGDFGVFGMGYAIDDDGRGESLHVADIQFGAPSRGLGTIDPDDDFALRFIGPFSENPGDAIELTSADDGELYGYFLGGDGGGTIVRIDKANGDILEAVGLPIGGGGGSLAFAYYGGDFYIFTGGGGGSTVTRYRPSDGTVTELQTFAEDIVGAGVTTCDPDAAR